MEAEAEAEAEAAADAACWETLRRHRRDMTLADARARAWAAGALATGDTSQVTGMWSLGRGGGVHGPTDASGKGLYRRFRLSQDTSRQPRKLVVKGVEIFGELLTTDH